MVWVLAAIGRTLLAMTSRKNPVHLAPPALATGSVSSYPNVTLRVMLCVYLKSPHE